MYGLGQSLMFLFMNGDALGAQRQQTGETLTEISDSIALMISARSLEVHFPNANNTFILNILIFCQYT